VVFSRLLTAAAVRNEAIRKAATRAFESSSVESTRSQAQRPVILTPQQVERHLHREGADALPVAEEAAVLGVYAGVVGDGDIHGSHGFSFASPSGTRHPGNGKRVGGAGAAARARGHGFGGLLAHGAVLLQDLGGTPSNSPSWRLSR